MCGRPRLKDYIDTSGCLSKEKREEYLKALEKYCDVLEGVGGASSLLRIWEEEVEAVRHMNRICEDDLVNLRNALSLAIRDGMEGGIDWKKQANKHNACDIYDVCENYFAKKDVSANNVEVAVLFYDLLAQKKSINSK